MDDFVFKTKPAVVQKKRKIKKQLEKEKRAKKYVGHDRYVKHQLSPFWVEEYEFDYATCEPDNWLEIYDENDWQPCRNCHYCGAKTIRMVPIGWELTFEHVNSR